MWFVDKILEARDARSKVSVLVHEAVHIGNPEVKYFIKVINISVKNPITITHVWVEDSSGTIDILNPERPLPKRLEITDVWETWLSKSKVRDQKNIFNNVRVSLSNGKILKSKQNTKVRPVGYIAGQ